MVTRYTSTTDRFAATFARFFHLWCNLRKETLEQKITDNETPLRSELFSSSQMEEHGRSLAGLHALDEKNGPERLLKRLARNQEVLLDARDLIIEAVKANLRITPAGEWLLDNFYLIEEQIRVAKRLLPKGYSRGLPRLKNGPSRGVPRVYDIALETISHGDGRVDPESLTGFVSAYQMVRPLRLGELWAIPIMLRLALIENLRRVAARIATDRINRNLADYWADRITETAENDPKSLILMIADMARSNPPMVSSFVAELTRRLQGQGSALALPLTWIEQQISGSYLTIDQMVQSENQQQASDQLSISNSIGSLRFLSAMDWRQFVDKMSVVEQTLRQDPAGVYERMDFTTRDQYRHVVEEVAKKSKMSEGEVAGEAIELARENQKRAEAEEQSVDKNIAGDATIPENCTVGQGRESKDRETHVGFYLISEGLSQLKDRTQVRGRAMETLRRTGRSSALTLYLGTTLLFTVIFAASLLAKSRSDGGVEGFLLWLVGILSLLCVSQLSIALTNLIATRFRTPHPLPRVDFSSGIPSEYSTLVVVPTMLTTPENVGDLMDALEVRFLANRDNNLKFGLITDFLDSSEEKLAGDELLLLVARQRVEELNRRYREQKGREIFFLFHRPRQWNQQEEVWMGYERKRGKLAELNLFLRGGSRGGFSLVVGNTEALSEVKYVITLDTDTELPRDSAWQLVGAMAHPLNRPHYDAKMGRIVSGYGILQPRLSISLPGVSRSLYARMWGSDAGIDPYTRVVSDLYQDIFSEGSFIGKGIYDVDAFDLVLKERLPENQILSHDLLEGCYARSGFISDVQLYEEYPSRYSSDVSRRRRWIRGDWQLLRWLFPGVPGKETLFQKNPISALSRWKIFDNLRRSLVPSALLLLLLLGWTVLPSPWFYSALIIGILLIPCLINSLMGVLKSPGDARMSQHLTEAARSTGRGITQALFNLLCLPHEAYYSTTAILHTLWLMLISGRGLLEWNRSGDADRTGHRTLSDSFRSMWIGPAIAVAVTAYLVHVRPEALFAALPILTLWLASPIVTWWISTPLSPRRAELSENQTIFLRKLSRKTWAFFETFITHHDHWLPPDNYQEEPVSVAAHRTSPTNIGLSLLSNLSACDFGYISVGQFMDRTANTLHTMGLLEQYRGHFYNWYDTESLNPLLPMYVSSVDSGNLAATLLTLRAGVIAIPDEKLSGKRIFEGLADTAMVLMDVIEEQERSQKRNQGSQEEDKFAAEKNFSGKRIDAELVKFTEELNLLRASFQPDGTIWALRESLAWLAISSREIVHNFKASPERDTTSKREVAHEINNSDENEVAASENYNASENGVASAITSENCAAWWTLALEKQCRSALHELDRLTPWAQPLSLEQPLGESYCIREFPSLGGIPTLRQLACLDEKVLPMIEKRRRLCAIPDGREQPDKKQQSDEKQHTDWREQEATEKGEGEKEQIDNLKEVRALDKLRDLIIRSSLDARERINRLEELALHAGEQANKMEYQFLYDQTRHLLSIGYNVSDGKRDESYYDLLASEARLTSFVAIAQGELPQESWFALGRLLTNAGGEPTLLSWSGSMFEYLMPLLVMPAYEHTLLGQSCKEAVARQIHYGEECGVPWGISESGYNMTDSHLNYQYKAFGVPGLGLKRGLEGDLVIAPYASALALMVAPEEACRNLEELASHGFQGKYGFYEAIDYTPTHLPQGHTNAVVKSFMAHHQGMTFLSLASLLLDHQMQRRFEADPMFKATVLLLQERLPKATAIYSSAEEISGRDSIINPLEEKALRLYTTPDTPVPEVQLLSNGRYNVMVTNAGGGYSRWKELAVTRWREDTTCDNLGSFCYIRDISSRLFWSTAYQPTLKEPREYEAIFSEGRAEFRRRDGDFDTHTEIAVSPEDDIELRRVTVTNRSRSRRTVDITSYAEVLLAAPAADELHPAFSNLFVQTEIIRDQGAIMATRRPRSSDEQPPWMFHSIAVHGTQMGEISYETDRMRFIGRGNTLVSPEAMVSLSPLSGSEGAVLDPVVAIRCQITLEPETSTAVNFITGACESRDICMTLVKKYQDRYLADRVFELAWTHSQVLLRQINATEADAQIYGRLASPIIYASSTLRARSSLLLKNLGDWQKIKSLLLY